jgi:hypothetical protein
MAARWQHAVAAADGGTRIPTRTAMAAWGDISDRCLERALVGLLLARYPRVDKTAYEVKVGAG